MDLLARLEERGALRRGLTQFRNGLVSDGWIEKGEVIRDPLLLDEIAAQQARAIATAFPQATLLVGVPACGAVLAAFVARHLKLPVAFPLLQPVPAWHRMHVPPAGQRVVYVDDLICTGTDARAVLNFLRGSGHHVEGVSAWISRVPLPGERLVTLADAPFQNHAPGSLSGTPVYTDVRE